MTPTDDKPQAQPWHAQDEQKPPARTTRRGAPIGSHSFTGGGLEVGMPAGKAEDDRPGERPRPEADQPAAADPLTEPRAGSGDLLGRR